MRAGTLFSTVILALKYYLAQYRDSINTEHFIFQDLFECRFIILCLKHKQIVLLPPAITEKMPTYRNGTPPTSSPAPIRGLCSSDKVDHFIE